MYSLISFAVGVVAFIAYQALSCIVRHSRLRPDNIPIAGFKNPFFTWLTGVVYFLRCQPVAHQAYDQARGGIFAIPTISNYQVCISDAEKLKDLNRAHPNHLSLNQFLEEAAFPGYTINGFHFTAADPRNKLSVRALVNGLRSHLPLLRPRLRQRAGRVVDAMVAANQDPNHGYSRISSSDFSLQIAGDLISFVVLGESFVESDGNVKLAIQYAFDAMVTSQVLAPLPRFLHPLVGVLLMKRTGACRRLQKIIHADVKSRIDQRASSALPKTNPKADCVQWLLDALPENDDQTAHEVTQRALGMFFAGMFQPQMFITFTLYELCKHTEYVEPLREALSPSSSDPETLIDSFLKEVARLNPLRAVSVDRKVMTDFEFSDGTTVRAGNTIAVPQQAVLLNPVIYPDPHAFNGSRFVKEEHGALHDLPSSETADRKFCHPSAAFPFWGAVSRPCPARFYVSTIVKETVSHILTNYHIELDRDYTHPRVSWGPNVVPNPLLAFRLTRLNPSAP